MYTYTYIEFVPGDAAAAASAAAASAAAAAAAAAGGGNRWGETRMGVGSKGYI